MIRKKVCVFTGSVEAKEFSLFEKYAMQGCAVAFMDKNKELGKRVKAALEKKYQIPVFFFHGDVKSEEDRELFYGAVQEMYGRIDYAICNDN